MPVASFKTHTALAVRLAASLLGAVFLAATVFDAAAATCRPKRALRPVVLKTMTPCEFDRGRLSFAGEPAQQARCLLRSMDRSRNLDAMLDGIPAVLEDRVGQTAGLPSREILSTYLSAQGLEWDLAYYLWQPVSRAGDNDPSAPAARYLVIHDTSGPNYGGRPWPDNIDEHPKINNLRRFWCSDGWSIAHVIINRRGEMLLGHDLAEPWRATKFERATTFGAALKGLFLHVELVQPRRRAPGWRRNNDALAPTPGFAMAQYDRLALVYTVASVRAGIWLVPAFHAAIDAEIRGGHDDPQNFDLEAFADSLQRLLIRLAPTDDLIVKAQAEPAMRPARE